MNCAFISQINAIASLCVKWDGESYFPEDQLLAIREALTDAVGAINGHLRWRRESQWERRGSHSGETE